MEKRFKMKNKKFSITTLTLVTLTTMTGCVKDNDNAESQARKNEKAALKAAGEVTIVNGTEARNVAEHIKRKDDPATIQFIYVTLPGVGILFEGPVVGGVTSSNKALKAPYKEVYIRNGGVGRMPLPHTSGTYGSEDDYVYWQDPAGNYYQTSLPYFMTDAPIEVPTPELSVAKIDMELLEKKERAERALRAGKKVDNNLTVEE